MSDHDERARLRHMLDYGHEVLEFIKGKTRQDLDDDLVLERALRYSIGIIGEAAAQIGTEIRNKHPEIEWSDIVGMRNFLFHVYFRVERDTLWKTATESIPDLLEQLNHLLEMLDSENDKDNGEIISPAE